MKRFAKHWAHEMPEHPQGHWVQHADAQAVIDGLQALLNERDAELDRLNPQWHPMDVNPPFPFTGDICLAGGLVRQGAAWCATYWAHRGRSLSRDRVLAWRHSPELSGPSL